MRDLLAAEVLKLRTIKATWALLAATVAISSLAVAGAIIAEAGRAEPDLESGRGVRAMLNVSSSGAIIVLVLGIIISAGEYRQRTATETFLTTPRRWRVIAAKLTVASVVLFAALFGGIGAATGSLVRNQVTAITGWLVWLSLVEHAAGQFVPDLGRWLPAAAGRALARAPNDDLLCQPAAALVLPLYGISIMGVAIVSERYRDA